MTLPLSIEALNVRAESGQLLLDIPHLTLAPGRSLGIRGPSGAGKSTVAMHVATALAQLNHVVSTLDLDLRQKTFGRYAANRARFLQGAARRLSRGPGNDCSGAVSGAASAPAPLQGAGTLQWGLSPTIPSDYIFISMIEWE